MPAAVAGYHAALGLAHVGVPAESWQQAMAVMGAIVVAATAWARMALSAPPDAGQGIAAGIACSADVGGQERLSPPSVVSKVGSPSAALVAKA
jgi:hypothetical protein